MPAWTPNSATVSSSKARSTDGRFRKISLAVSGIAALAGFAIPAAALAADYTYTTITIPHSTASYVVGVNESGMVLGAWQDSGNVPHGFTYSKAGKLKTFDYPGAAYTLPLGLNRKGDIVGTFQNACPDCDGHGFVYAGGAYKQVDEPPAIQTQLSGINDGGTSTGTSYDPTTGFDNTFILAPDGTVTTIPTKGFASVAGINASGAVTGTDTSGVFLYQKSKFQTLPLTGLFFLAGGINKKGEVVGTYIDQTVKIHGFATLKGKTTTIDMPGMTSTFVLGVNDAGLVTGAANGANDTVTTGFVYDGTSFSTIAVPGAVSTSAKVINRLGEVGGSYTTSAGATEAFVATPSR